MRYAWVPGTAVIVLITAATVRWSSDANSPADRDFIPAAARKEIKSVELEIERIEAESLDRLKSAAALDRFQQITLHVRVLDTSC
jgi:hypothetical protein